MPPSSQAGNASLREQREPCTPAGQATRRRLCTFRRQFVDVCPVSRSRDGRLPVERPSKPPLLGFDLMSKLILAASLLAVLAIAACSPAASGPTAVPSVPPSPSVPPIAAPPASDPPRADPAPSRPTDAPADAIAPDPTDPPEAPDPAIVEFTAEEIYLADGIQRGVSDCEPVRDQLPKDAVGGDRVPRQRLVRRSRRLLPLRERRGHARALHRADEGRGRDARRRHLLRRAKAKGPTSPAMKRWRLAKAASSAPRAWPTTASRCPGRTCTSASSGTTSTRLSSKTSRGLGTRTLPATRPCGSTRTSERRAQDYGPRQLPGVAFAIPLSRPWRARCSARRSWASVRSGTTTSRKVASLGLTMQIQRWAA